MKTRDIMKRHYSHRILSVLIFTSVSVLQAYGAGSIDPGAPDVSGEELKASPEIIEIFGQNLILETYLWRDFQPISPPGGKPLIALIRMVEADSEPMPEGLKVDFLWVIFRDHVWATRFSDEVLPPRTDHELERIARNGPQWGPNVEVEVIVRVRFGGKKKHWLLRASHQLIHRTD